MGWCDLHHRTPRRNPVKKNQKTKKAQQPKNCTGSNPNMSGSMSTNRLNWVAYLGLLTSDFIAPYFNLQN